VEATLGEALVDGLRECGHAPEVVPEGSTGMGHAGVIRLRRDDILEGGADPRSDGAVAAY
jgi:gamma-glutamyltranspeptidase/glutathione hydrolase